MSEPYRFSVESPDPTDKRHLDEWNETVLKQVVNARFTPTANRPAYLSGWAAQVGRLQIGRVQSSGGISKRDVDLVNVANDDRFNLLLPIGDTDISAFQNGREARAAPGGAALVRMDDVAEVQFHTPQDAYLIFMPKKELLVRAPEFDDARISSALQGGPAIEMIRAYLGLVETQFQSTVDLLGGSIANHLMDLILLSLNPSSDNRHQADSGIKALNYQQVCRYIARNYVDPDCNVDGCAIALKCSRSYLQKLVASQGTSFSDLLRLQRIEAACKLISAHGQHRRRLVDVAFDCGFSDLSTFYRAFKAVKGTAPGEYDA